MPSGPASLHRTSISAFDLNKQAEIEVVCLSTNGRRRRFAVVGVLAGATLLAAAHGAGMRTSPSGSPGTPNAAPQFGAARARAGDAVGRTSQRARHPRRRGIHKIRHVVIIMQENRSFDNYFGTFREPTAFRCATACRRCAFATGSPSGACGPS